MTEENDSLPILSFDAQERVQREWEDRSDRLRDALNRLAQRGRVGTHVTSEGNSTVHELVIAHAEALLEIGLQEYARLDLQPDSFTRCVWALANSVFAAMCPPVIHQSRVHLEPLRHDEEYRSRLANALRSRTDAAIEAARTQEKTSTPVSAKQIIEDYCRKKGLTKPQLAEKARLDVTVIYAICRGQKKCSEETLESLAALLGCTVEALRPAEKRGRTVS